MKIIFFLLIILCPIFCFSQVDTTKFNSLKTQITLLSAKVDKIDRDQNNYQIEKDLLKETYSTNYATVNLLVTAILGIFAVLTFFGTRDINSIKKEYKEELDKLRVLQTEIELKSREFDATKKKYDEEIKEILEQNESQNIKIKVLEIKDRINSLFKDKQYIPALEFCTVGLEISPEDQALQMDKSRILSKLNRFDEAIDIYEKIIGKDQSNTQAITNITELYFLKNQIDKANGMIKQYSNVFVDRKNFSLLQFFDLIKNYHLNDILAMKVNAKNIINTKESNLEGKGNSWDFSEAVGFAYHEPEGERKYILQLLLSYLYDKIEASKLNELLTLDMFPEKKQ